MESENKSRGVDQFLLEQIESVPHLEALLLLWNSRPRPWPVIDVAKALFIAPEAARGVLEDLAVRRLILPVRGESGRYHYASDTNRDCLLLAVDTAYRCELVRISRLIHSKPLPRIDRPITR